MGRSYGVMLIVVIGLWVGGIPATESATVQSVSTQMPDGMKLHVYFETATAPTYPGKVNPRQVLALMHEAYTLLTEDLGYHDWSGEKFQEIELRLTQSINMHKNDSESFQSVGLGFSPRFAVIDDANGAGQTPVIYIPENYGEFLNEWQRMNGRKVSPSEDFGSRLAGSIMHEMTHVVLCGYDMSEDSNSCGNDARDWYTEGLARYYETKMGSFSGFHDKGFRRINDDKLIFSRGGANYYLLNHNASIFSLRYENALFWLYFEKSFGSESILSLTQSFMKLPEKTDSLIHERLFQSVTGLPFQRLLVQYHDWVYREEYRIYQEGRDLISPAKISSENPLYEGIQPLAFQIHEMDFKPNSVPRSVKIINTGFSQHTWVSAYMVTEKEVYLQEFHVFQDEEIVIDQLPQGVRQVDLVISNLDDRHALNYEIVLGG